ncbi:MAG: hypothetical protein Q4A31_01705 [Corynebacterium sp.]|uniref:hypothetical protein n=1 Tax=Corynebacterium sp. TaxID=1720 RepID=UPI0026DB3C18|nr:hypothetical protein [Corynebacterium sp.]MDO4760621.1 hypothetical protein [Corynebacterium sp.]
MNTTTLHDGQSYPIARGDFLRIDGWLTQGNAADIVLDVTGDVSFTRAHDAQIYLTTFTDKANIVVRRKGGGEFPPDHSINIAVSQLGTGRPERVEFPQARLDGAAERVLGELVHHSDNQVLITAFGTNVANDLSRAAMTAVSAQRLVGASQARAKQMLIWADASASMYHSITDELLGCVEEMLIGVADYFDIDIHPRSHSLSTFTHTHAAASTTIGAQVAPADPDTAMAVVTVKPRPVLAKLGDSTVVLVVGANAYAEIAQYQRSYQAQFPLHLVAFGDKEARALLAGDHQSLRQAALTCALAFAIPAQQTAAAPGVTTPNTADPAPAPHTPSMPEDGSASPTPAPEGGSMGFIPESPSTPVNPVLPGINPFHRPEVEQPPAFPDTGDSFTLPPSPFAPNPLVDDPNGGQH